MMLNEPSVYACIGHALGRHAPGLADLETFRIVTHHLNLPKAPRCKRSDLWIPSGA
jgi:hypothetical protein